MPDQVKSGKQYPSKGIKHPDEHSTITGPKYSEEGYTPSQHGKGMPKKRG